MTDTSDVLDEEYHLRVQITFNDQREHSWGRRPQFAIGGLHYPLFWAAFPPVLGCFVEQHEDDGWEDAVGNGSH